MTQYHDTHYMFFYQLLPKMLRSDLFDEILSASKDGKGHAMMIGFWRTSAKFVTGVGLTGTLPRELDLTRDDFSVTVLTPAKGWTLLVITGPPVKGPLEALVSVAAFKDVDPIPSLKYFTCEAPAMSGSPWMIGMWNADSSRGNLGAINDVSITGMVDFVCSHLGLQNSKGSGSNSLQLPKRASENPFSKETDPFKDFFESTTGAAARSESVSIPEGSGPLVNSMTWDNSPSDLAQEAVMNLYRLRSAGKTAFVMSAKKASGLSKTVSSYVQFMWLEDDALVVEVQADYSYWGLSIPSSAWANLEAAGLARPNGKELNFHLLIPAEVDPSERLNVLAGVFHAFQTVMRPLKKIQQSSV